jgi:Fic family protein
MGRKAGGRHTLPSVTDARAAVLTLLDLDGVREAVDAARDACTQLRWHEALRRRIPEASAESRVRGARASAFLDGAELPVDLVRDLVRGARSWPEQLDPVEEVLRGAIQATAETEHVRGLLVRSPAQALARLHVAAASGMLPAEQVGRPRCDGESSREFVDLGMPPAPTDIPARLAGVGELIGMAGEVPVVVAAALVHAELAVVRPFVRGNGLVARAAERALIAAAGLDPTGVAVPEAGWLAGGGTAYLGALTAYASGTSEGVGLWLRQAAEAMTRAVSEGVRVADAVRIGRLS